jgi:PAS domain S-box-containing protein
VTGSPIAPDAISLQRRIRRLEEIVRTQALLADADLDLDNFLQIVVDRLRGLTRAGGSCIELVDGADTVYRAATEEFAAYVGQRQPRSGSLSGIAIATRELAYSVDAANDPRIDSQSCLGFGIRSMVCMPLFHGTEAIGALKIFAAHAAAFDAEDLDCLRQMGVTVGTAIGRRLAVTANGLLLQEKSAALQELEQEIERRAQLERSLRASESRLRAVIANAHQAIVQIDEAGLINGWNRQAELIFGHSAEAALGHSLIDLIIPERFRAAYRAQLDLFRATDGAQGITDPREVVLLRRTGEEFPVHFAVSSARGSAGWELTLMMMDITRRKEQNELFEKAFRDAAIGMVLVALDGRFIQVNEAFCGIVGYSADELRSLDFQSITHPDDLDEDEALLRGLLEGRHPSYRMDKRYIRKDGSIASVHLTVSLAQGANGEPRHFISQVEDVSTHRATEARYRLLADHASDMIGLLDAAGRWLYLSPACAQVLGFRPEELVGQSILKRVPPEDQPALIDGHHRLLSDRAQTGVQQLYRMRRKDGALVWVEAFGRLVVDDQGASRVVSVIRDVSTRIAAEEELKRRGLELAAMTAQLSSAKEAAEAANRAKSDFLAGMSHELRTPLNAVIGFADLLLESEPPADERTRYLKLMREAGRTLLTVVNDVLDLSKIEAGALELETLDVDLPALLRTCADLVRPMAEEKGLALRLDLAADLPVWVRIDPTRLRQVLLNLLNNAIKFTEAGMVCLAARITGDHGGVPLVRLSVEDTGIGIPMDRMVRIFRPFGQGDASTTRRYGGTGLGLSISRRLCGFMGGDLQVASEPGRGSVFWTDLPLPLSARRQGRRNRSGNEAQGLAPGLRILVAEDLVPNQVLVRAVLQRAGATVTVVADGRSALDAVIAADAAAPFHLVLMDVQMPGMDGLASARLIRALPGPAGAIPILALSAGVLPEEIARCRDAGMEDHVAKPIDAQLLLAAVARWAAVPGPAASPGDAAALTAPASDARPALCLDTLRHLEQLLGRETLVGLLNDLAPALAEQIAALDGAGADRDLARHAHALVSMAGNYGLLDLADQARALEDACRAEAGESRVQSVLADLKRSSQRALAALHAHV